MRTQPTRTIAGRVNADGSVLGGQAGWTVRRVSVGYYEIRLIGGARLIAQNATLISGAVSGNATRSIDASGQSSEMFTVQTMYAASNTTVGTLIDLTFAFTATVQA